MVSISTKVNGTPVDINVNGPEAAVEVIREQLGLTGTKLVCGGGVCGACTIQLDGEPVAGCLTPATALQAADVTTVEGLTGSDSLHPVQHAFMAHDGLQCGYCTPGFVTAAAAFVDQWRRDHGDTEPERHVIADALAGNLCRCGAYEGIYLSVAAACRGEHDAPAPAARVDAEAKVTGAAIYTTDVFPEGTLHGVIVRSPIAAADIGPLPASAGWVVDMLGDRRSTYFAGQPIAAVAADSLAEARRLASELALEVTPKPFVTDPDEAKAPGAPVVHADKESQNNAPNAAEGAPLPGRWSGNVRGPLSLPYRSRTAKRRIAQARERGDSGLVELEMGTAVQIHTPLEPHCAVADWSDPARLVVWASTQSVTLVHEELAEHYDLDPSSVEVHADFVGGGFGAKVGLTPDIIAAVELSRAARRPVRVLLDRREELSAAGNRPGSSSSISLLVGPDGAPQATIVEGDAHAGAARNGAFAMLAALTYKRAPKLTRDRDVLTHTPPGAAFRAPGGPTASWPLESALDQAAYQIGLDPLDVRLASDGNPKRQALYRWAKQLDVWKNRPETGASEGRFRRGVGVAACTWLYMMDPAAEVEVGVEQGRLVVKCGTQDMGTGSKTVLARAVAEVFDVAPGDVEVRMGYADHTTPHGPASAGSRTTPSIWSTAVDAAEKLKAEIGGMPSIEHDGIHVRAERTSDHRRGAPGTLPTSLKMGRGFSGAVHVSEVEVDTLTGKTRVLSVHGGMAVGRIHSPATARNQVEGAIIQGVGFALYEQQVIDPHTGLTLTSNLEDYRIPQLGDTPEIRVHFHEDGWDHVPGGGVGLGEVSTISQAPSIGNAIFNATGWRPTHTPIRPDRVLEALR